MSPSANSNRPAPHRDAPRHRARALLPLAVLALALIAGCATVEPRTPVATATPPAEWHAPLPHNGRVTELGAWWQQFDDPLLTRLIVAAQQASPSIATARARLEQSRATRVAADAALVTGCMKSLNSSTSTP